MRVELTHKTDIEVLKQHLQNEFSDYSVGHPPFNKKTLRVTNGLVQVVLGQSKSNHFFCIGNINTLDMRIFIPFILGIALGLLPGLAFFIVMSILKKPEYKALENEVVTFLNSKQLLK